MRLLSSKCLCPRVNKSIVKPIVDLLKPRPSSFIFLTAILCFPCHHHFFSFLYYVLVSLFHSMERVKIPTVRDSLPLSQLTRRLLLLESSLVSSESNVSPTQRSNLAWKTPMTVKTQPISRLESEVFLFLDLISTWVVDLGCTLVVSIFSWYTCFSGCIKEEKAKLEPIGLSPKGRRVRTGPKSCWMCSIGFSCG